MKLLLKRQIRTNKSTIGELFIDGEYFCYTLEDVERDKKIPKETAIPKGAYKIALTRSNRFKRVLPLLLDVPNFEGVRIHNGNTDKHTEGCILVGFTKQQDFIGQSLAALHTLISRLEKVDNIEITIE